MKLDEKYISKTENDKKPDVKKKVISDEAFAICEFLENLTHQIRIRGIL